MTPISLYMPDRYSRAKRKEQVVEAFRKWNKSQPQSRATMRTIAKVLQIRGSSYLMDLLWEMQEEGLLDVQWSTHWNKWKKCEFSLAANGD